MKATETNLITRYGKKLDLNLDHFDSVDELNEVYEKELGEELKKRLEKEQKAKEKAHRKEIDDYLTKVTEKTNRVYRDFNLQNQEFNSKKEIDDYLDIKKQEFGSYKNEMKRCRMKYRFRSLLVSPEFSCTLQELSNPGGIEETYKKEVEIRAKMDQWHEKLAAKYGPLLVLRYDDDGEYFADIAEMEEFYKTNKQKMEERQVELRDFLVSELNRFKDSYPYCEGLYNITSTATFNKSMLTS